MASNDQPQSRYLPSKDQVLGLMRERCATTCNPKGGCGGVCKRDIDTFTIDAIIQATAELSERSETEAMDAARYRWLVATCSVGKGDNTDQHWLKLKGYMMNAESSLERGWTASKENVDALVDQQMRLSERGG